MNWLEKVKEIKSKLREHGYDDAVKRLNDALMVLGTPGEMYLEVMNQLLLFKKDAPAEYQLVESEIQQLLDFGRSINYFNPPQ